MNKENELANVPNKTLPQKKDKSNITLTQVIWKAAQKSKPFEQLTARGQEKVLDYISERDLPIIVPAERGYDVLTKSFFVFKYAVHRLEYYNTEIIKVRVDFPDFDSFYDALWGDIYNNSCYYGYHFSDQEIKQYALDISKLNFDSITNLVYCTTCTVLQEEEESSWSSALANRDIIIQKIKDADTIQTYEELLTAFRSLKRKCSRPSRNVVDGIFCNLLLQKKKKRLNRLLLKKGLSVSDCFFYFGKEVAEKELEKSRPITFEEFFKLGKRDVNSLSPEKLKAEKGFFNSVFSFQYNRYKNDKRLLKNLADERNSIRKHGGINPETAVYYVVYDLCRGEEVRIESALVKYFVSFEEFVSELGGDLTNCNLKDAPLTKEEILRYKTDETTIFPSRKDYARSVLIKQYRDEKFRVVPLFFDSQGKLVKKETEYCFDLFFDFVHFLNGDLSNADLIMCDGVENIAGLPNLKIDGLKVRCKAAKLLNLPMHLIPNESNKIVSFEQIEKNESESKSVIQPLREASGVCSNRVAYITDLHLLHRFFANHCKTVEDQEYVIRKILKPILDDSSEICLFGGDVASDYSVFQSFVSNLSSKYVPDSNTQYFFTLGNHELWSFTSSELSDTVREYRNVLSQNGMHLVHNNLFYLASASSKDDESWFEITEDEMESISDIDLRARTRGARLIIFGGMGFAGNNTTFNANQGIYRGAINREQEIQETERFNELHRKVSRALYDKNVIVFTHMPIEDWSFDQKMTERFVYVNGHRHINRYYDDGKKRLYADNQIGYTRKEISLKHFFVSYRFDWFADVPDGIHEITADDYRLFYRGIYRGMGFNRYFEKFHLVKRERFNMFFAENDKGELYLLSGGQIKKMMLHPLEYYYERMLSYAESVRLFTADYYDYQKKISNDIKSIGGDGDIHGCIIDLNYYNHLYVNPFDGTITPYKARSMTDKYLYKNIPSLLKIELPDLYQKYVQLIAQPESKESLPVLYNQERDIIADTIYEPDTVMYRVSWLIHRLQDLLNCNIILIWNDDIANKPSKELGKTIAQGMLESE